MINKIDKKAIKTLEIIIVVATIAFTFWRCQYGHCYEDEPFIITLGERLFNGNVLYADEWHASQNTGILILPFYALFKLFNSNNTGIILTFRYVYCALWSLTCLYVFYILKKRYKTAIVAFVMLMLFQPLDYYSLSYNSFALMASLLLCCELINISSEETIIKKRQIVAFSIFNIVIVFCCPLWVVVYCIALITLNILNHKKNEIYIKNLTHIINYSLIICGVAAIAYLVIIFKSASVEAILKGFVSMFDTHSSFSYNRLRGVIGTTLVSNILLVVLCLTTCVCAILKKEIKNKLFIVCLILFVVSVIVKRDYFIDHLHLNYESIWISMLGFTALLTCDKKTKEFYVFYVFGLVLALIQGLFSSDTGLQGVAGDLLICMAISAFIIIDVAKQIMIKYDKRKQKLLYALLFLVFVSQISLQLHVKFNRQYYDATFALLNNQITTGAAKGIYTSEYHVKAYESESKNLREALDSIDTTNKDFMCVSNKPFVYLDANLEYNTISVWTFRYSKEKLNKETLEYIKLHDNKYPDIIVAYNDEDILPFFYDGYKEIKAEGLRLFIRDK